VVVVVVVEDVGAGAGGFTEAASVPTVATAVSRLDCDRRLEAVAVHAAGVELGGEEDGLGDFPYPAHQTCLQVFPSSR
jgi:hypothetical protein